MSFRSLTPQDAKKLVEQGAVLVDIREADEHARERIPGAQHHALSLIEKTPPSGGAPVIFHCRSGNRTLVNADRLQAVVGGEAFILEGGIDAWKKAGLPVIQDKRQPLEMMRQVQIAAGSLVLLGVALGAFLNPAFYALSALVGAGLVFAGATGTCGMASLLSIAPWNRHTARAAA